MEEKLSQCMELIVKKVEEFSEDANKVALGKNAKPVPKKDEPAEDPNKAQAAKNTKPSWLDF